MGRGTLTQQRPGSAPPPTDSACDVPPPDPRGSMLRMQTPLPPALHMQGAPGPSGSGQEQGCVLEVKEMPLRFAGAGRRPRGGADPQEGGKPPQPLPHIPSTPSCGDSLGRGPVGFISTAGSAARRLCSLSLSPIILSCIYNSDSCSHPECIDFSTHAHSADHSLTHPPTPLF